jgi:type I restriction enzyme S subunit
MTAVEFGSLFHFIRNGMNVRQDKSGDGLPVTRIETISNGTVDGARVGYAGLSEGDCKEWLLAPGDILFSHINSAEHIGKCALYKGSPEKLVHGMNLLCLRCDASKVYPEFARHLIRSAVFRGRLSNYINRAVNQASVSVGNLKRIRVDLPDYPEQRRIAEVLCRAESLQVKRSTASAALDEIKLAAFMDLFGDPATNPKQWPVKRLRDLLESATYGTSAKAGTSGEYPILRMNNITSSGSMDFSDLKYIALERREIERYTLQTGDILFNRTNSPELVGKTALYRAERPMAYAGYLVRFRVSRANDPEYLAAFMNTPYTKRILRAMCKSIIGMANINSTEAQSIQLPVPPTTLQNQFAQVVRRIEALRDTQRAASVLHGELFAALQHRAFAGGL